jgi:hypothetical protein
MGAALALLIALIAAAGWMLWRRREQAPLSLAAPASGLTPGLRRALPESGTPMGAAPARSAGAREPVYDSTRPAEAEAPREPARIDLSLTVDDAARSLMRFTIGFTLEVFNRSDHAVRDLNVSAKLACARRGNRNAARVSGGQPIGAIERIGPQQSRKLTGKLQLPIEEITPIDQAGKPVLIPLVHIMLEGEGRPATTRTFVVGTPSTASKTRVHPLLLEGPPGSFARLRAQLIRQPDIGAAAPRPTEPA